MALIKRLNPQFPRDMPFSRLSTHSKQAIIEAYNKLARLKGV